MENKKKDTQVALRFERITKRKVYIINDPAEKTPMSTTTTTTTLINRKTKQTTTNFNHRIESSFWESAEDFFSSKSKISKFSGIFSNEKQKQCICNEINDEEFSEIK